MAWSTQKTSEAEFFIKLMEGNVWALVDLEERIKVRYVDYQNHQFFVPNVNHQRPDLENDIHDRFVR